MTAVTTETHLLKRLVSGIALALVVSSIVAPLVAVLSICSMPCCKHNIVAMKAPMGCETRCPEVSRSPAETTPMQAAAPAPVAPIVYATSASVETTPSLRPPRLRAIDDIASSRPSKTPLHILDSVFLI
ncbi:MAG: hypothetical protein ACXVJT_14725 [Thermoanaerobaculia bacterium]